MSKNRLAPKSNPKKKVINEQSRPATSRFTHQNYKPITQLQFIKQQLNKTQSLNHFYLAQIHTLEEDNLALCSKIQELRMKQQVMLDQHLNELEHAKRQNDELVRVVHLLEKELAVRQEEIFQCLRINEEQQKELKLKDRQKLQFQQLQNNVQKYKLKLLESQKYWMTRSQILLGDRQADTQNILLEKDSQFNYKMKLLQNQLQLKNKIIQQKDQQIYALIAHLQKMGQ